MLRPPKILSHSRLPKSLVATLRFCFYTTFLLCALGSGASKMRAQTGNCNAPQNAIVAENCLPGSPSSVWDIGINGDDPTLAGFATDISVNTGQTVSFKINSTAKAYSLDIYRIGYYGGQGARKVASIVPAVALPQSQPACLTDSTSNLVDCGNWAVSAEWQVPTTSVSGVYFVLLTRPDTGGQNHIVFIVRNDGSHSNLVFQTADESWQAYNDWQPSSKVVGHSLYGPTGNFDITNRAFKVSYNRPFHTRDFGSEALSFVFGAEYPMIRWLEANGYDLTYVSGLDVERSGNLLLNHKAYLSVGHDEYVSGIQRTNIEAARDAGVNLAFFSGNETFWKTRWETSIDGTDTPYRTLACYKETYANAVIDPQDPPTWTGTFRDSRFSPPADGGRPENALHGTLFMVNGPGADDTSLSIKVPQADGQMRFWRNTSVAALASGAVATLPAGTLGYEWDADIDNGFRPAGLFHLSSATYPLTTDLLLDYGETYGAGNATHNLVLYRAPSGALVFGAGTVQWSWGLDANHDDPLGLGTHTDIRMQQATVNLFADMGIQPATLQANMVAATPSTDTAPPISTITSPDSGSSIQSGTQVTITGTASDSGGGVVGGVEVSYDGGNTWHPATGRGTWSYNWAVRNSGTAVIKSRAVDDSGNLEVPSAGSTVTVAGQTCPCSIWSSSTAPVTADGGDGNSIEVGVSFTSQQDGYISGIRFYKSKANVGQHIGNLWTGGGVLLGSAVFTSESASGWQQVSFSSPVAITANTTYVASYYAPVGHYAADAAYFATSDVSNPPLDALANSVSPNGVFNYASVSAFPTSSYNATNYWVDVVFTPSGATSSGPVVVVTAPSSGASGVSIGSAVTASFNEPMNASSINTSTFWLSTSADAGNKIAATVQYNPSTLTATLVPAQPLAYSTAYTADIVSGSTGVQDSGGRSLLSDDTWSFTTGTPPGVCPCTMWNSSSTPVTVDSGDNSGIEVGVKFRSDENGFITALRFYKSAANTGTHIGDLWTSTGIHLASATFTGESSSGWQQVNFASPVPITSNTTYLASYFAPSGHYSASGAAFATAGVDVPPLHALAANVDGPNGVYSYGSQSTFPHSSYNSSNYWIDVVFNPSGGPGAAPTVVSVSPASGAGSVSATTPVNATFSESMDPATISTATFQLLDASSNVVPAAVTYNGPTLTAVLAPAQALSPSTTYTATLIGGPPGVKDAGGDAMAASMSWSFTTAGATLPGVCPCSIWSPSTTPNLSDGGDPSPGEYGGVFYSDQSGYITGIRFYKSVANTGVHLGHLWSNSGTLLASATFTGETTTGWQQVSFSNPVYVTANTPYIASYYAPSGHYSANVSYFATIGVDNSPLHAPANGVDGPNGLFNIGASTFPTSTYNSTNYWVDVVFTTTPTNGTGPIVTSVSPSNGSNTISPGAAITATFSEAVDPATITSDTFELLGPGGAPVPVTVSYNPATMTVTLTSATQLASLTSYNVLLIGGSASPRIQDLAGYPLAANYSWSFTTIGVTGCPCTIWPASTVPSAVDSGDATAGEFGVKFTADQSGYIAGIRFYKTLANAGPHIANLWTDTGVLLATATFTGETNSGWQQVNFPNAVAITANTDYVASYYAPNGHYSADSGYFATSAFNNTPLHALANGADGPNGVFTAGPASSFPTSTFNSANYWVDVVFTNAAGGTISPAVTSISPGKGATGVSIGTSVNVTFNEAINPATLNSSSFVLTDPSNNPVVAKISYNAASASLTLTSELAPLTTYTVTLMGGASGNAIQDLSGNPLSSNFSWSFTTGGVPSSSGPGGPILVVTNAANPFTSYLGEILQAEGLNEYTVNDISGVTAVVLSQYDVAILGDMTLTPAQVSMLTTWVNSGGNLIAMHPDPQLAGLLGLSDTQKTLSDSYLLMNTGSGPGLGLVNQTVQFHGAAELYSLNGASSLATLYSSSSAATSAPAVSLFNTGSGHAAAFAYDLARSIVYTRQGNPAWSGELRDGLNPIRSDDLFVGAAAGDPEPDWVDRSKIAIPQADEQQRLLANLILQMNLSNKPLPRFWYFPLGYDAVVVMTGDDHGGGGTAGRFNTYLADSPQGCSLNNWQCVRSTSYIYANNPLTNTQAASYVAQGFEVGLHVDTNPDCSNFSFSSLSTTYANELAAWTAAYPNLPAPTTMRAHCVVWSDYDSQPRVESNNGIRLDATYYYYPAAWVNDQPGFFTGSGMPMRFTAPNGTVINVYQAATQLTDESGQTYPFEISTLLGNATGPLGYYGVFTANMHNDTVASAGSDAIVASAQSFGVPIVSALQMRQWLDGRNSSSFKSMSWDGSVLSFAIATGSNTNGIQAMLPMQVNSGTLVSLTQSGTAVTYTPTVVKGIQYAVFQGASGNYQATYGSAAQLSLSTFTLQFANQSVGTGSGQQVITLANTGSGSVTLTSIATSGANAGDFSQSNTCGTSLAAGANCSISVTFLPTAAGNRTGTVVITDNASGSPQIVTLTGTGVAGAAVSLSPTALTFGNQTVGTSSIPQTITLSNTGGTSLSLTSIATSGANAGDFSQSNTCGTSLAAGANCSISVTFLPTAAGNRTGTVVITDNASGSPQIVTLTGTGVAGAAVSLSPTALTFGNQTVGTSSIPQTITLSNTGGTSLSLTSIAIAGANAGDFAQTNTCGASVGAGANCSITTTFVPTAAGNRTGTVVITDNASGSPQSVTLTGTGVAGAAVSLSPTALTFGNQTVGTGSVPQTVTLSNTGGTSLSLMSIAIAGANAGDFSQTNTCGASVAAGASCSITTTFVPTAAGIRSSTVVITDNASGSPQSVTMSGTGVTAAAVSLSPTALTFGNQTVGTSSVAKVVKLTNTGGVSLSVTGISIAGSNSGDFSQTNTCGTSVAVGASCNISVAFAPTAAGRRSGSLTISDSANGSPQGITLTGTGLPPASVSLSSGSLVFTSQSVGTVSVAQAVSLSNTGAGPLSLTSIVVTGSTSGDFSQTNNCGTIVAAGSTCQISVKFKPAATGSRNAAVAITDNVAGSPQTVSLSGTGVAPVLTLTPASLAFSAQMNGTTSSGQTVTLSNTGSAALTLTSISVTGGNSGDFMQTNTCGVGIGVNASCLITVTFTPTRTGMRATTLKFADNASGSPQSVSLTGNGIAPRVGLTPPSISFATQPINSTSAGVTVWLTNTGTAPLTIASITISGTNATEFNQTNGCGTSLAVRARCTISAAFSPQTVGLKTASLVLNDNASGSPQTIPLKGTATALPLSPSKLTFAKQAVGTKSAGQIITLRNIGSASIAISSLSFTGANASSFTETTTCGTTLNGSASCSISVFFVPLSTGTATANLSIGDSDPTSPQTVTLAGVGQ